jgi:hypothetical protein
MQPSSSGLFNFLAIPKTEVVCSLEFHVPSDYYTDEQIHPYDCAHSDYTFEA